MTPQEHNAFTRQVIIETDVTALGVLLFNLASRQILAITVGCLAVMLGLSIFSHIKYRAAMREVERVMKEYLDHEDT